MLRSFTSILSFSFLTFVAAADEGWSCSNNDMEIGCSSEKCEVSTDSNFTPTNMSVAPGYISFCAYSGCWVGVPYISLTEDSFYAVGPSLRWNNTDGANMETIQIAIDTASGRGVLIGGGFAMPMQCEPWVCGEDCKSSMKDK